MNMKINATATIAAIVAVAIARLVVAQPFDLSWNTVDAGGATFSTGGTYSLGGTIAQSDAGPTIGPMVGGAYSIRGGFWPATVPACTCPGDMNGDSLKNGKDIQQFVAC